MDAKQLIEKVVEGGKPQDLVEMKRWLEPITDIKSLKKALNRSDSTINEIQKLTMSLDDLVDALEPRATSPKAKSAIRNYEKSAKTLDKAVAQLEKAHDKLSMAFENTSPK